MQIEAQTALPGLPHDLRAERVDVELRGFFWILSLQVYVVHLEHAAPPFADGTKQSPDHSRYDDSRRSARAQSELTEAPREPCWPAAERRVRFTRSDRARRREAPEEVVRCGGVRRGLAPGGTPQQQPGRPR